MGETLIIISFACIGYLVAETEISEKIKSYLFYWESDNLAYNFIKYIFYCSMCFAFWSCLLFTFNPLLAVISAVLGEFIGKFINYDI